MKAQWTAQSHSACLSSTSPVSLLGRAESDSRRKIYSHGEWFGMAMAMAMAHMTNDRLTGCNRRARGSGKNGCQEQRHRKCGKRGAQNMGSGSRALVMVADVASDSDEDFTTPICLGPKIVEMTVLKQMALTSESDA